MRIVRNLLVIAAIAVLVSQAYAWGAPKPKADTFHGARYALQEDLWGFMYTLRLRHCSNPAPETLVRVEYRPADSFVAYRCEG